MQKQKLPINVSCTSGIRIFLRPYRELVNFSGRKINIWLDRDITNPKVILDILHVIRSPIMKENLIGILRRSVKC